MARRNIFGFKSGKRKVLSQGQGSVVYSTMEMDSHSDTFFCGSNCIVMNSTVKECDVAPYTVMYKTIKVVSIV